MADLFSLLDWVAGSLLAGSLAMTALSRNELRFVRLLIGIAALLTVVRWGMWSFTSDAPWPLRATIGAVIGALLLGGLPALWKWSHDREQILAPSPAQAGVPTPKSASTILVKSLKVEGEDIDVSHVKDDGYIDISLYVFNGSDEPVQVSQVSGTLKYIRFISRDAPQEVINLPSVLIQDGAAHIPAMRKGVVVLRQRITFVLTNQILAELNAGKRLTLDFDTLDLEASIVGSPADRVRVPTWARIDCELVGTTSITRRVNQATLNITIPPRIVQPSKVVEPKPIEPKGR